MDAYGVRAEYETCERKLKEEFSRQLDRQAAEFNVLLADKQNEINSLKGVNSQAGFGRVPV